MKVSIIVPVKKINDYIRHEIIPALSEQTYKNFELIIVPDKKEKKEFFPAFVRIFPSWPKTGPADKRNLGASRAKGEILAFIDDDAYPEKDWLAQAITYFKDSRLSAVCGPGVTPPDDSFLAKVSGWMWVSALGAGGAGTYRCQPEKKREVDDYPTFNLLVRRADFVKVGGFDPYFWPGEDTKLTHDLVYKLGQKIIYDPHVLVYHHRRKVFFEHLKQIGRYGLQRGFFVKILPRTSRKLGYFIPFFFTVAILLGPFVYFFPKMRPFLLFLIFFYSLYFCLLLGTTIWVFKKSKNLLIALLLMPTIFLSHIFYGSMFFRGILTRRLKRQH